VDWKVGILGRLVYDEVKAGNNHEVGLFQYPRMELKLDEEGMLTPQSLKNARNQNTKEVSQELLEKWCGGMKQGVQFLIDEIFTIEPEVAQQYVKKKKKLIGQRLSPEQMKSIGTVAGLTGNQLTKVGTAISQMLGYPIFAGKKSVSKLVDPFRNIENFSRCKIESKTNDSLEEIRFWWTDVFKAFTNHLDRIQAAAMKRDKYTPIGIDHGPELGRCFMCCVQTDKGGKSLKEQADC
jgi:hypothetical protein